MRTVVALLFLVVAAPNYGTACSCGPRKPFCEAPPASAESKDRVVFLGAVESATPTEDLPHKVYSRLIRLRVAESFVGSLGKTFEVPAGTGQCCDCSPSFAVGDIYLVVAYRHLDRWATSVCSGTSIIHFARQEIAALRAWKSGVPALASIEGSVTDMTRRPHVRPGEASPGAGLRITLNGPGVEREARTGPAGEFLFDNLPAAKYELRMAEPGWTAENNWSPLTQGVDLTHRSCSQPYFMIKESQASVRGQLTARDGVPLKWLVVETVPVIPPAGRANYPQGRTNDRGEFTITDLEPGEYIFGMQVNVPPRTARNAECRDAVHSPYPTSFYPGVADRALAHRFTIARGQTLELAPWPLPAPLAEVQFEGRVQWPDGSPAADARVFLTPPSPSFSFYQRAQPTGADGIFSIWGVEGMTYRLFAIAKSPSGETYHWGEIPEVSSSEIRDLVLNHTEQRPPFPYGPEFDPFPFLKRR